MFQISTFCGHSFSYHCFISWLFPVNKDEIKWLTSQLQPLSCYCTDHVQPSSVKLCLSLCGVDCLHALWNETPCRSLDAFHTSTRWAMYVHCNTEACSCNHFCCGKAKSITYYECVFVDLDSSMKCAYAICDSRPVQLYKIFPHYLINGTIFLKKLLNIKCVFWFSLQLLSETFLILRRKRVRYHKYQFSCKVPIIIVIF